MRKGDKEKSKKGKKNSGREWPKKEGAKVNELYHKIKKKKENEEQWKEKKTHKKEEIVKDQRRQWIEERVIGMNSYTEHPICKPSTI